MVVSVILGFMLYAFIRQSESFQKNKINKVNFLFEKAGFVLCLCMSKCVCF